MSMIGTIGLISFVADQNIDYAIKNVALFKTSKTPELAYYFLTFLKSKKTQQYIEMCLAGSTQKYISLGELRKMPIQCRPHKLQNALACRGFLHRYARIYLCRANGYPEWIQLSKS